MFAAFAQVNLLTEHAVQVLARGALRGWTRRPYGIPHASHGTGGKARMGTRPRRARAGVRGCAVNASGPGLYQVSALRPVVFLETRK